MVNIGLVIDCCLMAPSHFLNQCWLIIVNWTLGNKLQWNLNQDTVSFHSRICIWKLCLLQNGHHFVLISMCQWLHHAHADSMITDNMSNIPIAPRIITYVTWRWTPYPQDFVISEHLNFTQVLHYHNLPLWPQGWLSSSYLFHQNEFWSNAFIQIKSSHFYEAILVHQVWSQHRRHGCWWLGDSPPGTRSLAVTILIKT